MTLLPFQIPPTRDWTMWTIIAGRGKGKSYASSAWILDKIATASGDERLCVALVGPSISDAEYSFVRGPDNLLDRFPSSVPPFYDPSRKRIDFPNGARAYLFGCEDGDLMRGHTFHYSVAENIESWLNESTMIDELWLSTRGREDSQICLTAVDAHNSPNVARIKRLNENQPLSFPISTP